MVFVGSLRGQVEEVDTIIGRYLLLPSTTGKKDVGNNNSDRKFAYRLQLECWVDEEGG